MSLALMVVLSVIGVAILVGIVGYLIDKHAGREERKWEHE